jgi:hypothetical protein
MMRSCSFWQLIANNMTQGAILATSLGLELFLCTWQAFPTRSSKIIGKQLVLSLHKQLRLQGSRIKKGQIVADGDTNMELY